MKYRSEKRLHERDICKRRNEITEELGHENSETGFYTSNARNEIVQ